MRHLGIDYGTGKVGLALSDEAGTMGFPHTVLPNDKSLMKAIEALVREREVGVIVIGESLNSLGEENRVAKEARAFGDALQKALSIPVAYEMEAFSTQEARRDFEGNRENNKALDASAAALVLTSYLSRTHGSNFN